MRNLGLRITVAILMVLLPLTPFPMDRQHPGGDDGVALLAPGRSAPGQVPAVTRQRIQENIGRLPLYFVENKGQVDGRVAYYLQARNTTVYFTAEGLTYALTAKRGSATSVVERLREAFRPRTAWAAEPGQRDDRQRWALKLDFVGAIPGVRPKGQDLHPTIVSYFKGPRDEWRTGLKTYSTIVYEGLWPGIDLVYAAGANQMKYMFVVKPGADPARIRLAYRGATNVRINGTGQLEVATPAGNLRDDKPYVYQEIDERRVEVESAYDLAADQGSTRQTYGFRVGVYDMSKSLIIDPAVIVYGGYIGGASGEGLGGIAVDNAGNAYVTSSVDVSTFPVMVGPDLTLNGDTDAFVAKVNASGTALVYAGYIGGSNTDVSKGIGVDSTGNAIIAGFTRSNEQTFPVTVGPDLVLNGTADTFVAKVNTTGTALVYAGYIGGDELDDDISDGPEGIAVDSAGNAYITGFTSSPETSFPVTVGPDLIYDAGITFSYVAKVNPGGTAFVYAGYIDGVYTRGIAADDAGNAYVMGEVLNSSFPATVGPDLTPGPTFVAKINPAGTAFVYAGYIDGSSLTGIAADGTGNAYVTGSGLSSAQATVGPDLTPGGGFVAKINPAGTAFVYAGYIDGSEPSGIAADDAGNAYVTGRTVASETTFPVTGGPDLTYNGGGDAFIAKVNATGTALVYAGYIGGIGFDRGAGIAVDGAGSAYVAGDTGGTFPAMVGPDLSFNGGSSDGFVVKIGEPILVSIDIKPSSFPNAIPDTDPLNLSSNGVTPVAIFTTPTFDASTVNVNSVLFAAAPPVRSSLEDVDGDGDLDLVLHFDTQVLDLNCSSVEADLTGQTSSGGVVEGTDTIRVLKDKNGAKCP